MVAVLHMSALKGYTEMTDILIKHGAVVNATDYQGMSPLHYACLKGHQAVTVCFTFVCYQYIYEIYKEILIIPYNVAVATAALQGTGKPAGQ